MGSIFFHEVAHLIGVPHTPLNESLFVANCECNNNNIDNKLEKETEILSKESLISINLTTAELQRRMIEDQTPNCLRIPLVNFNL